MNLIHPLSGRVSPSVTHRKINVITAAKRNIGRTCESLEWWIMLGLYSLPPSAQLSPHGLCSDALHTFTEECVQVESDHWHDFTETTLHFKVLESHHCRPMIYYSEMSDCCQRQFLLTGLIDSRWFYCEEMKATLHRCIITAVSGSCQAYYSAVR